MGTERLSWYKGRWFVVLLTFLTRIPFVFSTFGTEENAWRIASSGMRLAKEGFFQVSRLPGFPVAELSAAVIVPNFGAVGMNLVSAVLGAGAVNYFYKICEIIKVPRPWLASLAFGFVPVLFLSSMTGIDYIWSLLFFVAALEAILSSRYSMAGIWLGLAIGSRITYVILLLPLMVLSFRIEKTRQGRLRALASTLSLAAVIGTLFYVPVVRSYNLSILTVDWTMFQFRGFRWEQVQIAFGVLGLAALLVYFIFRVLNPGPKLKMPRGWVAAYASTLLICFPAALALPEGSIFLLPILPFLMVQLFSRSAMSAQVVMVILMVLSPFFIQIDKGEVRWKGAAITELEQRRDNGKYLLVVANLPDLNSEKKLIVVGRYFSELAFRFYESTRSMPASLRELVGSSEVQLFKNNGGEVFYLRNQDEYIRSTLGFDLKAEGARELEVNF